MIAVTGATGKLGRLIIENLLQRVEASEIVAVVRTPAKAAEWATQGVVIRQGDYADANSLITAFTDIQTLMFISNTDVMKRMEQHQNVVNAAKTAGVKHIIYTSFIAAETDDMLGPGHLATEKALKESGMTYTILRPNFYMDLYVVEVEIAAKTGVYRTPRGDTGVTLISRQDIARTAAAILTGDSHAGQTYNLTGSTVVTPTVLAETASKLSGQAVKYQPITWEELTQDYIERGMPEQFVQISVMLEKMIATNTLATVSNDITQITGQPAESFESYVSKSLTYEDFGG